MPFSFVRIITSIFLLIFLAALQPSGSLAADSVPEQKTINVRLSKQQKKIERLQKNIQSHQEKILVTREKEQDLLVGLESIDANLRKERTKLRDLQSHLDVQEDTIHTMQSQLASITEGKDRLQEHLQNRLAAFYRMGSIGYMNVVFSTSSLPDLLNFQEYFHLLLRQDRQLIERFREKIAELTEAKNELQQGKQELLTVIVDIKDQEEALAASRNKRTNLLTRVRTEKKLYQRALNEMEQAANDLDQAMVSLRTPPAPEETDQQARPASPKKKRPAQGIAAQKGRLKPPVRGTVTTFFGPNTNTKFDLKNTAKGIDISPLESRTRIRAIYPGRVIYADTLKGYGQMIIIDHGYQYYSLTSRISELKKQKGDLVHGGEVIGIIESESGLIGEGLHFEMRKGTEPMNPLHWIDNGLLRIKNR